VAPDPADDDEETVDLPADCGGRGEPPELRPPPVFELAPDDPGVTGAEGRDGVELGGAVAVVVTGGVVTVVVGGGGVTGGDPTVVVVTVGTVIPGTVIPGMVMPGMVTPGTVTPGTVTPGTDTVGVLTAGPVPALLAFGTATNMDSKAPATRAMVAVDRLARLGKPPDEDLSELSTRRRLTGWRSKPRWVRPHKIRSRSPAS